MTKGFSINGWVFLLVLLSLFAGSYYLGGVRCRQKSESLAFELQVDQKLISGLSTQLEEKDKLLLEQKLSRDLSIDVYRALIEQYRVMCGEAIKREAAVRKELKELKSSNDAVWWTNPRYLGPDLYLDDGIYRGDTIYLDNVPHIELLKIR